MGAGTNGRVFHYHADANPFGGNITTPLAYTISTQASTSVSEGGGHVHSSIGSYQVMNAISVQSAYSEIYGLPNDKERVWESHVTSVVQGLNILDVVTADEIVCRFTVKHPYDDPPFYPSVDFGQCGFAKNLRVNGSLITPILDLQQFSRTADDVLAREGAWLEDPVLIRDVCTQNAALTKKAPAWVVERYSWVRNAADRQRKGHAVCSLVQRFKGLGAGTKAYGHVLEVEKFGRLFFGELIVHQGAFGVTMLRAEIITSAPSQAPKGPGLEGTIGVAVAHTNAVGSP